MQGKYFAVIAMPDIRDDNVAELVRRYGTHGTIEARYRHKGRAFLTLALTRFGWNDAVAIAARYMAEGNYTEIVIVCEGQERTRDIDD